MKNNNPKKYTTIVADPPWSKNQKGKRGAIMHYDLMTLDRIKNMPVGDLAADNAAQNFVSQSAKINSHIKI